MDGQGRRAITLERTPRIILLASHVLLLCNTRWLWIYENAFEPDGSHTSAPTFLDDKFQNFNSHVFMKVDIFGKRESTSHFQA